MNSDRRKHTTSGFFPVLPALLLTSLLLHGCAVKQSVPPPSYPPATAYPVPAPPSPVPPPEAPAPIYSAKTGAAGSLYAAAQESLERGNYEQAELALERALRIEPRNGHYWYTMAQVKYRQKHFAQTMQLCLKSKSFAGQNGQLLRLNDGLMQKAQQQLAQ